MTDRIKDWDEYFGTHCHLPASAIRDLFDEIERLKRRIEELENGVCRFNCRTQREAFIAGTKAALPDWEEMDPGAPERAFKEWKDD